MRAITIWQPYASLIILGLKEYETRGWATSYRGPLIIHAAKRNDKTRKDDVDRVVTILREHGMDKEAEALFESCSKSVGCVVGAVELTDCKPMMDGGSDLENEVGFFGEGRFGWKCEEPKAFAEPIPAVGKQGLWIPDAVLEASAKWLIEARGEGRGRSDD